MAQFTILVLFSILFCVDAGSPLWEPSIVVRDNSREIHSSPSFADNDTIANAPSKRWVTVDPDDGTQIWPHRKIVYAYNSDKDRDAINEYFITAKKKWYNAGLSEEAFTYEELAKDECVARRHTCMMIQEGESSRTSLALRRGDFATLARPTMQLNLDPELGHLDTAANVAHELGVGCPQVQVSSGRQH
jgi:hypothetical protein